MRSRRSNTISEADFESLPPALQRKYFSSLERLRLAQDGSFPIKSSKQGERRLPSRSGHKSIRTNSLARSSFSSLDQRLSNSKKSPIRKKLRSTKSVTALSLATPADAAWFSSLPPKLQRTQFSREERIFLATQRDNSVIVDAADEVYYKRGRQPSTSEFSSSSLSITDSLRDFRDLDSVEEEMEHSAFEGFRWLEEDDDLDLSLDDYHTAVAETSSKDSVEPRRKPTFRRNMSLSSISFRRSSGSSQLPGSPTTRTPPLPSTHLRPVSTLLNTHKHRSNSSISSIDPSAKYYRDPEARLKLRVYLASPQKFDEAVEFGFPSLQEREQIHSARPQTCSRLTQDSPRTFLSDDTPSLSGDEDNGNDDLDEHDDPRTPQDIEFHRRSSKKSCSERTGVFRPRLIIEPYAVSSSTREMTLHMTLTRPDLRAPEEVNTIKNINDQPLKLAELPCDDVPQSIWDTLPEDASTVRKLWRRLRNK